MGDQLQEMMGWNLILVPKKNLKLPVRSSETSVTREGVIGMFIGSSCQIVSQSDIRVRIVVTIPCNHHLGSWKVMDLYTSVRWTSSVSILKVVYAVISTNFFCCALIPKTNLKPASRRWNIGNSWIVRIHAYVGQIVLNDFCIWNSWK